MKRLTAIAIGSAVAVSSSAALAQTATETQQGTGDAVVTLITNRTAEVKPGFDSWVSLQWMDDVTDAREFEVTASGGAGVTVGYPENTVDHSGPYWDDALNPGEVDYTALKVNVDPSVTGPVMLDVTLTYVSDSGPVTVNEVVEVAVDTATAAAGLRYSDGSFGTVAADGLAWFDQELTADVDVSEVEVEVADSAGFTVSYPSEATVSRPANGSNLVAGSSDVARLRFDAAGVSDGTHDVTLAVTYFVGTEQRTDTIVRQITVGDGATTATTEAPTTTAPATTERPATTAAPSTTEAPTTTVHVPAELASGMAATGWTFNPIGTDSATTGAFELGVPQLDEWSTGGRRSVTYTLQPAGTPSGEAALVTSAQTSNGSGAYDLDGGVTSALSQAVTLPTGVSTTLEFSYYFAYLSNSSSADFLKITVIGENGSTVVLEERGAAANRNAVWTSVSKDISAYAGQEVRVLVEAADNSRGSLVEAAITNFSIFG